MFSFGMFVGFAMMWIGGFAAGIWYSEYRTERFLRGLGVHPDPREQEKNGETG